MESKTSANIKTLFLVLLIFTISCSSPEKEIYNRLMEHANSVKVINTHEHQRHPKDLEYKEYNFWTLLNHSYLMADVVSAGGSYFNSDQNTLEQLWEMNGAHLNHTVLTSYNQHFLEGLKMCYDYDELAFTKDGIENLSNKITEKYKDYDSWYIECFEKYNFETMFLDQYWAPHNSNIDKEHYTFVLQTNLLVANIGPAKLMYTEENEEVLALKKLSGVESVQTLDDFLDFAKALVKDAKENGAVAIKNSQAYWRSINYDNISLERATELFTKAPEISKTEEKELQDFMFHWLVDLAAEYQLPVQIHTGYLAGNGNQLDNGQPIKLNNLFLQHPNTKFDLFHGGFPWTGEFVALGKMFPNVYLNLVWLPQISKQRAIVTFNEMLDCVPYNKFLWGGDCHFIEETVGSLEFGKQVVCEVLTNRILNGQIDEPTAEKIISAVFRKNAIKVFKLDF